MTRLDWGYSRLARVCVDRPDYAGAAVDALLDSAVPEGARVVDLWAGARPLTRKLAERGPKPLAVDSNAATRADGTARLGADQGVIWAEGGMQATGFPDGAFFSCHLWAGLWRERMATRWPRLHVCSNRAAG